MYERYFKRILDLTLVVFAFALLSPFLAIVSAVIYINDGFPVFFRQTRVGRYGKSFQILKFRTMTVDGFAHHGSFDAGCVARVTRWGAILRKYKIDELPQLVNVLKGEMSLVGPRPEIAKWTDAYPDKWKIVLAKRPGITDWASIVFRNEEDILSKSVDPIDTYRNEILPGKLAYNIDYVSEIRFCTDIYIIFSTIKSLVRRSS